MATIDQRLLDALEAAGIVDDNTRRVVIDIQVDHIPIIHVEKLGDEKLIHLVRALDGLQIEKG